jgi:hypothetical protein
MIQKFTVVIVLFYHLDIIALVNLIYVYKKGLVHDEKQTGISLAISKASAFLLLTSLSINNGGANSSKLTSLLSGVLEVRKST